MAVEKLDGGTTRGAQPAGSIETGAGTGGGFRGDVEGLRAVALFLVFLFAAGVPRLRGALVGVDAFFVISGFLITGLLVREVRRSGTISLSNFYARRARRIVPSAAFVSLLTLLATAATVPDRVGGVARDVIAAGLQVTNWWFTSQDAQELSPAAAHSPLKHYWSLAVEEQFYLLWPLLLLAVAASARRRRVPVQRSATLALAVLTTASLITSVVVTPAAQLLGYMGTGSRAWQFGAGGLLALSGPWLAARASLVPRWLVLLTGWAGAAALGTSALWVGQQDYPGWAAVVPTLGAAAVIAAGTVLTPALTPVATPGDGAGERGRSRVEGEPPAGAPAGSSVLRDLGGRLRRTGRDVATGGVSAVLEWRWLRYCGRLSYAWYLWHVPVTFFATELFGVSGWPALLVVQVLAGGPAWLTMVCIEQPLRHPRRGSGDARRGLVLGAVATAVPLAIALLLV